MASKTNLKRTRRMRTLVLSAGILSFLPLVGVMQAGQHDETGATLAVAAVDGGQSVGSTPSSSAEAYVPVVAVASPTATAGTQTTSSQSAGSQSATGASYTRTRAS